MRCRTCNAELICAACGALTASTDVHEDLRSAADERRAHELTKHVVTWLMSLNEAERLHSAAMRAELVELIEKCRRRADKKLEGDT